MIDRYSRPAMKLVWSDDHKYETWLRLELAVCEAWTEEGVIPPEDMVLLRNAKYDSRLMQEILVTVHHETNAFLEPVSPSREANLVDASIKALDTYWSSLTEMYGDKGVIGKWAACLNRHGATALKDHMVPSIDRIIDSVQGAISFKEFEREI